MRNLQNIIDENSGSIVFKETRIPIKHVSYLTYSRKHAWGDYFINAFLKSAKLIFLLVAVYIVADAPAVDQIFGSRFIVEDVKTGIKQGLCESMGQPKNCDHHPSSEETSWMLTRLFLYLFFLIFIANLLPGNPYVIKITSSSGENILMTYKGSEENVSQFFDKITWMAKNSD